MTLALVPSTTSSLPVPHPHTVQFYETESYLVQTVAPVLARGVKRGHPVVVIATKDHWRAFADAMTADGVRVDEARERGAVHVLDAQQTLDRFMTDGMPDPGRFAGTVGALIDGLVEQTPGAPIVAYGDMVDLLWRGGQGDAAIRLEELWNGIAASKPLSLLCAYALDGFHSDSHSGGFADVCRLHSHVVPAESYSRHASGPDQLNEIARLQQCARSLETELARRRALEAQLVEAVRARDEFISVASHELRNPTHVIHLQILGALQAARSKPGTDPAVSDRLNRAADHVSRLARLLDSLLDVSRITEGRIDLEIEDGDLSEIVRTNVERFRDQLGSTPVTLRLAAAAGRWDRLRLDQVVTNLLSNAVKYGEGRAIEIRVAVRGDMVTLSVEDQGIGIDAADLNRVFARFERASSMHSLPGFGLGLWITREIVEAMGGSITASSRVGHGSTFIVALPLNAQ